jgi:hypothetical protein
VVTLTAQQAASDTFAQLQAALPGIQAISGEATKFKAPVIGPCDLTQFSIPEFSHFLPLNCQLIDPLKLTAEINTHVPWLFNLDLADVDHVFSLPLGGFVLSGLAVIAAILQFVQVKMTSPRPNPDDPTSSATSTMTYLFPLLTIFWGGIFPSGLILYWIIYTGYLVAQQYRIMGWGNLFPIFGWQPGWAPDPDAVGSPAPRREATQSRGSPPELAAKPSNNPRPAGAPGNSRPNTRRSGRRRRGRKR